MLIIEVMGGLGNQLQQYALYWKLKSMGRDVKLDISWFADEKKQAGVYASRQLELTVFVDLPMDICTKEEKEQLLGKNNAWGKLKHKFIKDDRHFYESDIYHPEVFELENAYLTGFWACEKYYADILPELRKLILFPEMDKIQNIQSITNKNMIVEKNTDKKKENLNIRIMEEMHQNNSVSLHIRRGDYLDRENAALFGGICTDEYYEAAERYVEQHIPNAHYYIFSDDPSFAENRYKGAHYTIVNWNRGADSFRDMQLMSCCKHNICANSTFSFWGARLNPNQEKIMIRPAKHKNGQIVDGLQLHELWENWVFIDETGIFV